jgi:hypothetical protein
VVLEVAEQIDHISDYEESEYSRTRALTDMIDSEHYENEYVRPEANELVTVKTASGERVVRAGDLRYT